MSVVGIDFGNENCYIAVARAGGVETVANEYSQRLTPSYVALGEQNRDLGVSAKNKQVTNIKNTIYGLKNLIGRSFRDPVVQNELKGLPYQILELPGGAVGIKVRYLGEDTTFQMQHVTGMLFTKLKEIAEAALQIKVNDCVVSVPVYFTDAQRRALQDAASIAGLNVLRLLNETTAVALTYGFYKNDLPETDKGRNIAFVDLGHCALQASICTFNKGKLKMLAAVSDHTVGGRKIDQQMASHFCEEFKTRYHLDVPSNKRAVVRLMTECEKLKKQLSANPNDLPLNIECFMNDIDVSSRLSRDKLEELMGESLKKIEVVLEQTLKDANLKPEDIEAIEIVGGSSRIPAFKRLVTKVFKKEPSTTLNQDEAVARGCALHCAMLSPTFKVRDFSISDIQPYPIKLVWDANTPDANEMEVFPKNHAVPFTKMLTFFRTSPFTLEAYYMDQSNIPTQDSFIGSFQIKNVVPTASGESNRVKVKARINLHGMFSITSATLVEKPTTAEESQNNSENSAIPEAMETDPITPPSVNGEITEPAAPEPAEEKEAEATKKGSKKKPAVKSIDLPIETTVVALSNKELEDLFEREGKMIAQDKLEKERADAKNAVEEYVYDMRANLSEKFEAFVSSKDRDLFASVLEDTENWLYDEGENQQKSVYIAKLAELKKYGNPIVLRFKEFEERPQVIENFVKTVQRFSKILIQYDAKDPNYEHLSKESMELVRKTIEQKQIWLDQSMNQLNQSKTFDNPPITCAQLKQECTALDSVCRPLVSVPKPKVEAPPPPPAPEKGAGENNSNGSDSTAETPAAASENSPPASNDAQKDAPMETE